MQNRITIHPDICNGRPIIANTRIIPKHKVRTTDSYRKAEPKDNPNLQYENIIYRST